MPHSNSNGGMILPKREGIRSVLVTVDEELNAAVHGKVGKIIELAIYLLMSDGWMSVQHRPVTNALATSPIGQYFCLISVISGVHSPLSLP